MKLNMEQELTYEAMPSWNETLQELLWRENIVDLSFLRCFNLKECFIMLIDHLLPQLEAEIPTTKTSYVISKLKSTRSRLTTLFDDSPTLDQTKTIIGDILTFTKNPDIYSTYCSKPPMITSDIDRESMKFLVGYDLTLSIAVQSDYPVTIHWYFNQKVIRNEVGWTFSKKNLNVSDSGFYTCSIANKFGETSCGTVKVGVYQKPVINQGPESSIIYLKSPDDSTASLLICNASNADQIQWFHQSFDSNDADSKSIATGSSYNVLDAGKGSGFYWCKARNQKLQTTTSMKAEIFIINTTLAAPRMSLTMELTPAKPQRGLRAEPLSTDNRRRLALALSTNEDQIEDVKISDDLKTAIILLKGESTLMDPSTPDWNEDIKGFISQRDALLNIARSLHDKAKEEKIKLASKDGKDLEVVADTLQTVPVESQCGDGQSLMDNGFICGKF